MSCSSSVCRPPYTTELLVYSYTQTDTVEKTGNTYNCICDIHVPFNQWIQSINAHTSTIFMCDSNVCEASSLLVPRNIRMSSKRYACPLKHTHVLSNIRMSSKRYACPLKHTHVLSNIRSSSQTHQFIGADSTLSLFVSLSQSYTWMLNPLADTTSACT
jgi:hypothetical protein